MKKIVLITLILFAMIGCGQLFSQIIPTYPIPSFNIYVNGTANFRQDYHQRVTNPTKEKREVHVVVGSQASCNNCTATVWVYRLDHSTILGPYTVTCGQTLTVPIDDREWGVLVESDEDIIVSVWIESFDLLNIQGFLSPASEPKVIHKPSLLEYIASR